MRIVAWVAGVAAFVVMLYACALPGELAVGPEVEGGLAGVYTVNGVDPTGAEYSGTVVIRGTDRADVFDVEWIVTGAIQRGRGVRDGERLSVTWSEVTNATDRGTGPIVYRIEAGGELDGSWRVEGFDEPGRERLFPEA